MIRYSIQDFAVFFTHHDGLKTLATLAQNPEDARRRTGKLLPSDDTVHTAELYQWVARKSGLGDWAFYGTLAEKKGKVAS